MHEKDYIDVEALTRQAYRMRDEAVARMISDGWRGAKRLVGAAFAHLRELIARRSAAPTRRASAAPRRPANRLAHH